MLPPIFMPDWLKAVSSISPIKWGILALEGAQYQRDFTLENSCTIPDSRCVLGSCRFLLALVCFAGRSARSAVRSAGVLSVF